MGGLLMVGDLTAPTLAHSLVRKEDAHLNAAAFLKAVNHCLHLALTKDREKHAVGLVTLSETSLATAL